MLHELIFVFVDNIQQKAKNVNILSNGEGIYFKSTHMRFGSNFYGSQLADIFAYEVPTAVVKNERSKQPNRF